MPCVRYGQFRRPGFSSEANHADVAAHFALAAQSSMIRRGFARGKAKGFSGLSPIPHSVQPSFFSTTGSIFPWASGGFLERRIPGKDGEGRPRGMCQHRAPRKLGVCVCVCVCFLLVSLKINLKQGTLGKRKRTTNTQ